MCGVSPVLVEPDLVTELLTITAMYGGSGPAGGGELFPGSVVQALPQLGTLGRSANPLKLAGAAPVLSGLRSVHWAPQNVTFDPMALSLSPMTKAPPPGANGAVQLTATALEVIVPAGLETLASTVS